MSGLDHDQDHEPIGEEVPEVPKDLAAVLAGRRVETPRAALGEVLLAAVSAPLGEGRERFEASCDDAFGYLVSLLGDAALAEEALEEAFLQLERGDGARPEDLGAALRAAGAETVRLLTKAGGHDRRSLLARLAPETRALLLAQGLDFGDADA